MFLLMKSKGRRRNVGKELSWESRRSEVGFVGVLRNNEWIFLWELSVVPGSFGVRLREFGGVFLIEYRE